MRKQRNIIDVLIALLLAAVLIWCAFLFWGAYSQHRLAVLLNESVLAEIKDNIKNQVKGVPPVLNPKTKEEIAKLEKAQNDLFDTNTISFLFQSVTLLLITISAAVLWLMYRRFRSAEKEMEDAQRKHVEILGSMKEEVEKAQRERKGIQRVFSSFVVGRNTSVVLGVEYCLLYTLSCLFEAATGNRREALRMMIADYQGEIERNLEDAVREKEGLEHLLFEIALDMADQVDRTLRRISSPVKGDEKTIIENIIAGNARCRRILRDNGKDFENRYEDQWSKMKGED